MEGNPPRLARKNDTREGSKARPASKNRYAVEDGGGDLIECSGKFCRSCSAGLFADCVAICCCPCAVVNLLALALVKIPWIMGRRCLGLGKRKLEMRRKCKKKNENENEIEFVIERDGTLRKERAAAAEEEEEEEEGTTSEFLYGREREEEEKASARFEADRVWLELYQVGHLGFGRVSFTGIQ